MSTVGLREERKGGYLLVAFSLELRSFVLEGLIGVLIG